VYLAVAICNKYDLHLELDGATNSTLSGVEKLPRSSSVGLSPILQIMLRESHIS
jgi:hypothetical protein